MLIDAERRACGDIPYYPGHPITLAVQIARAFPNLDTASARGYAAPAALEHDAVSGAGGNVYTALQALDKLRKGEPLETVLEWADGCREYPYRSEWPAACEQARRYLATIDLVEWVRQ